MQHIQICFDFGTHTFREQMQILNYTFNCTVFSQQLQRSLLTNPFYAGIIITGIAHKAFQVNHLSRG
ncbi:hypothetical protein D3C85_1809000 [compost metagenome]